MLTVLAAIVLAEAGLSEVSPHLRAKFEDSYDLSTQSEIPHLGAMENGNWELAETLVRRRISEVQQPEIFYFALGLILEKLGRPYEAMEAYYTYLEGSTNRPLTNGAAAIRYGDLARQMGQGLQADLIFRRFEIQRYEGADLFAFRQVAAFESLQIPGEAIAAYLESEYSQIPVSKQEWPGLWHTDLAARSVRLAPHWPHAWKRLGDRLSRDGWKNKAWVAYQEAAKRYALNDPDRQNALNRIIVIESQRRQVEIEDDSDPTGYRMVNVELPGKRFRDDKNPNPRSNIAWPLPGPVPPDWH